MTSDHFKQPHEPPITLEALVERLHRRTAAEAQIVLVEDRYKLPNLDRWVIGAATEEFSPIEVWLPGEEHDRVFPTLSRFWKPVWGAGDTGRAVPAAQVSWSIVWTLGPLPLRVWTRRALVLSIDDSTVRGSAMRGRTYNTSEIVKADSERRFGRLRVACVLQLGDGTRLTIAAGWFPSIWSLYDDDDYEFDVLSPLSQRINEALAQAREAGRK